MRRKTKEELEAEHKKTVEELEKQNTPPSDPQPAPTDPNPAPTPEQNPTPVDPKDKKEEKPPAQPTKDQPTTDPKPAPAPAPSPTDPSDPAQTPVQDEDYKKKFTHSAREGQILNAKVSKFTSAIDKAVNAPEPTDEEMKSMYPNWEAMEDDMKVLAKQSVKNQRAISELAEVGKEAKDIEAWNKKVDTFIEDPTVLSAHPELEGKQEEFKLFASKPTRRGVDFEDLVAAFQWDESKKKKTVKKGGLLEVPTPGPNISTTPKEPKKLTVEEGKRLRENDYPAWVKAVRENRISKE